MDKVHTRSFDKRIVVNMNEKSQLISDDDKVVSELGYFPGTLKRSVPLTYKSWRDVHDNLKNTLLNYVKQRYIFSEGLEKWVMRSINVAWRGYKSRLKDGHYTAYSNDGESLENRPNNIPIEDFKLRLENRPDNIPIEDFKLLLTYGGDEEVQAKAKKNSESRK